MFTKTDGEEHNFWISYTDLVMGFMIIFIVIALMLFNRDAEQEALDGKYKELVSTFESSFADIKEIEVTEDATIRFLVDEADGQALFEFKDYYPTTYFKKLLDQFIPVFFNEVYKIYDQAGDTFTIKELRIEGHTDSRGNYLQNLTYSSGRAVKVQSYVLRNDYFEKYPLAFQDFVKQNSIACGYSFSRLLDEKGDLVTDSSQKEDPDKSRRVEFRILLEYKK